jgi:hypothetical protein
LLALGGAQGRVTQPNVINTLDWLTAVTARIEPKGVSGALANPQRDPARQSSRRLLNQSGQRLLLGIGEIAIIEATTAPLQRGAIRCKNVILDRHLGSAAINTFKLRVTQRDHHVLYHG